jgi:LPXTG-motif cell wall-anchored protein
MAKRGFLAVLAAMICTVGLSAHHPFTAEFDMSQSFTLAGTVTSVEWQNPHVYTYIDAKDEQGKVVNWKVEMGSPAALTKEGWTQTSIKTGDVVTIKAWKSKTNAMLANADSFTISGKTMTAASSAHGAPSDQLARADAADPQGIGTAGTQELPSTGSPLAFYALLGGLSLAGAFGLRAIRR